MPQSEYNELKESIAKSGVLNHITLHEGMVLDGWHRYRASTELDIHCPSVELDPEINVQDFVIAQNRFRRHCTTAQLIASIQHVYNWRPSTETKPGKPVLGTGYVTNKEVAEKLGVGLREVERFRQVERNGSPEVLEAAKKGKISLKRAAEISALPKEQQPTAIEKKAIKEYPSTDCLPDEDEIRMAAESQAKDMETMQRLMAADDKLASAFEEIKRLNAEIVQLRIARDGYMREAAEYKKIADKRQRENDRLRKGLSVKD